MAPAGAISSFVTMFSNVVCCSRRKNEYLWSKGLIDYRKCNYMSPWGKQELINQHTSIFLFWLANNTNNTFSNWFLHCDNSSDWLYRRTILIGLICKQNFFTSTLWLFPSSFVMKTAGNMSMLHKQKTRTLTLSSPLSLSHWKNKNMIFIIQQTNCAVTSNIYGDSTWYKHNADVCVNAF